MKSRKTINSSNKILKFPLQAKQFLAMKIFHFPIILSRMLYQLETVSAKMEKIKISMINLWNQFNQKVKIAIRKILNMKMALKIATKNIIFDHQIFYYF